VKAIIQPEYGSPDVLRFEEIDQPVAADHEVLVRVRAASVNPRDWHFLRGLPYVMRPLGLRIPGSGVLGSDVAGQIEAVGGKVTRFRPGDEVYAHVPADAFAEYACVPEEILGRKPGNLTFEEAAAVPLAALTALQGLRDHARVQPGQKVLIIGASGGVGTFAVQLGKFFGAEVTGVCSTRNVDRVRSIGADRVNDYTREDFTQGGRNYDLIFQLAGTRSPWDCRRALTPKGMLIVSTGESRGRWVGPLGRFIGAGLLSPFVSQRLGGFTAKPSAPDLEVLKEMIEAGKLSPVIDRTYSLSEVPEAIRYLEEGHARGKVVISV
jgi:NADPH:quinone reductase-like Zn-dependent oxidoreductase